jgi:FdhE protein
MGNVRERVHQLKAKRPGYAEMLDFYVEVREAQAKSKTSLKMGVLKPKKEWKDLASEEGVPLVQKEAFPVDLEAAISLFRTLCRVGKTANPHMAGQVEKIAKAFRDNKRDLKELLTGGGKGEAVEQIAADRGLDKQVLSFLVQNSIRPSIEAGREQLRGELDPETWRKSRCPVCGSLPSLNLLLGEGGKRYSRCSYCGYQWRIDRLFCAVCGNKEQESLNYFYGEGEEACRIDLCDKCHHYIKTIDYRNLEPSDVCLEDLATLHLDVLAVQKGYQRSVPNPWST